MTSNKLGGPIQILIVEDNPGDVRLVKEALRDAEVPNNVHVARDGLEAIAFLRQQGKHINSARPNLILLDLNLPKKDGREVLAEIKNDDCLRRIPVVVLTISKAEDDITATYNLHANCYVCKPVDFDQFVRVIKSIEDFWLTIANLPPSETRGRIK